MAAHLAFQLERLQAMREAAAKLMARDRLGRDVFARGVPEDMTRVRRVIHTATLLDLMQGYARIRTRDEFRPYAMDRDAVFTLEEALERLRGLIGFAGTWTDIASYLPEGWDRRPGAAAFGHGLDLCRLAGAGQGRPGRDPAGRTFRAGGIAARGIDGAAGRLTPVRTGMLTDGGRDGQTAGEACSRPRPWPSRSACARRCCLPAPKPLTVAEMEARMPHGCDAAEALAHLRRRYEGRGVIW